MKIGKLTVKKVKHLKLGEVYEIIASNTETQEVFTVEGDTVKIRVSKETAKKLGKVFK